MHHTRSKSCAPRCMTNNPRQRGCVSVVCVCVCVCVCFVLGEDGERSRWHLWLGYILCSSSYMRDICLLFKSISFSCPSGVCVCGCVCVHVSLQHSQSMKACAGQEERCWWVCRVWVKAFYYFKTLTLLRGDSYSTPTPCSLTSLLHHINIPGINVDTSLIATHVHTVDHVSEIHLWSLR